MEKKIKIENKIELNKNNLNNIIEDEEVVMNGEFISTYFAWVEPDVQKERANKLNDITKNK